MNNRVSLGLEFIVYGLVVGASSLFLKRTAPELAQSAYIVGIICGALSVVWGVLCLNGYRQRWWVILSMAVSMYLCLAGTVMAWGGRVGASAGKLPAVIVTVMLIVTFGMLMNLLAGQGASEDKQKDAVTANATKKT